jgi:dolichol kinase
MNETFVLETKRKLFHFLSAAYALLFTFAGRPVSLWVLGLLLALVATLEAARLRVPALNKKLIGYFGGIHREEEVRRPSGILWTLTGCFLTIWLVPHKDIALAALWYLAVGDAAAGLVGRTWGHIRLGRKSLEGSLSCFVTCWFVGAVILHSPFGSLEILFGALVATIVEALPLPLNDNLWIPTVSGLFLTALRLTS